MRRILLLLLIGGPSLSLVPSSAEAQFSANVLPFAPPSVSTVPSNGDGNPYGVAYVPSTVPTDGVLQQGDILVANFNNSQNIQGTGSIMVRVSAAGKASLFNQTNVVGLTGALGILSNGIVVVGNLPTSDGTAATAGPGALTFIDRFGNFVGSIVANGVNGPWGLAISDPGAGTANIFVSNVLSGAVIRYTVSYTAAGTGFALLQTTTIGSGFSHQPNAGAVVLGPSGLCYDPMRDLLYVASSNDNAIYSIAEAGTRNSSAGKGNTVYNDAVHLHGPLDLAMTPIGHLLVANSDGSNADPKQPSELVEFTTGGQFVSQFSVDPNNGGAFGIATFTVYFGAVRVAAVDDNANTLSMWTTVVH